MLNIDEIHQKVQALTTRASDRDQRAASVQLVRQGRIAEVYPDFFPEGIDQNVVANFIDIVARDLSEVMAPLPAINCATANMNTPAARKFADTRTLIGSNYFRESDLQVQMYSGSDRYITYGFLPFIVEVDVDRQIPCIRVESPIGAYPEFDRYGRCTVFVKKFSLTIGELISQFPEHELKLRQDYRGQGHALTTIVEVVRYYDKRQSTMYIPSHNNLVLSTARNPLGKMMVVVARRPSPDEELRGQFDDVLGIQLLRNRFALLAIDAAEKSIQAPIVLPMDVQELQFGGDATIKTANPQGVRRLELTVPQVAFTESQSLNQELRVGARYPESRTGNVNASVITGQGVQALLGAFDTQIKSYQAIMTATLRDVLSICFEADEKIKRFNKRKTIRGVDAGAPYVVEYKPSEDIDGDYTADIRYGMLAGLNPAQGLIFMLQATGGGLLSNDAAMREMPFGVNVTNEQEKIEVEKMRRGLLEGMTAMTQAIPQLIMLGQDPSEMISKLAQGIKDRQEGKQLEDIFLEIFPAPPPPEEQEQQQQEQQMSGMEQTSMGDPQQGMRPPVQDILNKLSASGAATGSVSQSRQAPLS